MASIKQIVDCIVDKWCRDITIDLPRIVAKVIYTCPFCGKTFMSKRAVRIHIMGKHTDTLLTLANEEKMYRDDEK